MAPHPIRQPHSQLPPLPPLVPPEEEHRPFVDGCFSERVPPRGDMSWAQEIYQSPQEIRQSRLQRERQDEQPAQETIGWVGRWGGVSHGWLVPPG